MLPCGIGLLSLCLTDEREMIMNINKSVLPDEEYVDIDGWINEGGKGEEEEESPLESRRRLSLLQLGVLQAHLQTGWRERGG